MDLKQLRAFLTVADTGSVTRAGEVLHLVQPAISRQLRLLEEDVGAPLFERERHGMVLTDSGRALLGYARRAMLELDRARAEIAGASESPTGIVTVGLLPSTSDLVSSALVSAASEQYPGIRIRIAMSYAGDLQQWLESGEIDVALLYGVERSPQVQSVALVEEALWVVGPTSAKLRPQRPMPLASLAGRPLVLPSGPHGLRTLVDHACAVANVALTVAVETNAMSVQKSLVLRGHGLTVLPPIAFWSELSARQVSAAPLAEPVITRTIARALPANRAVSKPVQCISDLLVQCAKEAVVRNAWPRGRWLGP